MSTYEKIVALCKEKGIAVTFLEKELGFGRGSIGKLKGGNTSYERIKKIAEYFDVAVSYLMEEKEEYYIDEETAKIAQELLENKELKMLMDVSKDAKPERLLAYYNMIKELEKQENGE